MIKHMELIALLETNSVTIITLSTLGGIIIHFDRSGSQKTSGYGRDGERQMFSLPLGLRSVLPL